MLLHDWRLPARPHPTTCQWVGEGPAKVVYKSDVQLRRQLPYGQLGQLPQLEPRARRAGVPPAWPQRGPQLGRERIGLRP